MLLSKLLNDYWDALKAREDEVVDLCRGMEEVSAAGKAATEEISRLKIDVGCEVVAHSSREEKLVQLKGE